MQYVVNETGRYSLQVNESHGSQSSQSSTHQTRSKRQPNKADAKESTKKKERPSKRKRNTETEYKIADIIDKEVCVTYG